jgi:hypothetical protein
MKHLHSPGSRGKSEPKRAVNDAVPAAAFWVPAALAIQFRLIVHVVMGREGSQRDGNWRVPSAPSNLFYHCLV